MDIGILNEVLRENPRPNWLLIWSLGLMIGFVLTRIVYPKYWRRYRQAVIFTIEAEKLLKEKNINLLQTAIFLNGLGSLSVALFLFVGLNQFEKLSWPKDSLNDLALFSGFFVLLNLLKIGSNTFLGIVLKNPAVTTRINHSWLIHLKAFGFVLLLFAIASIFLPDQVRAYTIIGGFVVLSIMLVMNYLRAFQVLMQERISLFYGILYLCTLEISPILVIASVVIV